jgi:putative transcriptional regulator
VQSNRGFVIHEPLGQWDSTLAVSETLGVSTSRDIIVALAEQRGPSHFLLALGYAGWEPGQLEKELAENAWLSTPADMAIVFSLPSDERWDAAARLVGVDIGNLSPDTGHA